jgi:hypothetical protein
MVDGQRQNVYKWLHVTDPSPLHYQACKNYTAGTGNWMLRSPQWQDWIKAKQRCLWIHGIPGAGKTVLLSYLTEQIEKHCADMSDNNYASVYYYCSYGHNQDEAGPFLRWILNRLCRMSNYVPNSVYRLYNYGGEPTLVELLAAIEGAISTFERVYIIFDAVDESHPREDLLKVIRDIATDLRFKNLQLLVSSREYLDIEHVMEGCSIPVSMSNSFVTEDIRCFVQSTLERNPKFKHWPEELFKEVEDAVSIQAKGMYVNR